MKDLEARFLKTYANLPLPLRSEIAVVVDDEPLTWNVLKLEVDAQTEKGKRGLVILDKLRLLPKL